MRRSGYGDAARSVTNGSLPLAQAVRVASEGQLRDEIDSIAAKLQPIVDWNQRVDALLRLEGLVLGGAGDFASFAECLIAVRDSLICQVLERRSAVSRQACHALSVIVTAGGITLEALVVQLLPVLLKAIAMGIQVVTDAADACARSVIHHCHTAKMLPRLCSTITSDKNAKLRQCASSYLLQILEQWEASLLERHTDAVESAILAAAQDAQSDTRAAGRSMFAIYGSVWPASSSAMLHRIDKDKPLQDKLLQALEAHRPGFISSENSFEISQQGISRRSSLGPSDGQPGTPRGSSHAGAPLKGAISSGTTASLGPRLAGRVPAPVPKLALSGLSGTQSVRSSPSGHSGPSLPNSARLPMSSMGATPRAVVKHPPTSARAFNSRDAENLRPNGGGTPRVLRSKQNGPGHSTHAAEGLRMQQGGREVPRRSMGGAALRISIAALAQDSNGTVEEDASKAGKAKVQQGNLTARRLAAHPAPLSARGRRQSAWPQSITTYSRADVARRVEADSCSIAETSDSNTELASCSSWEEKLPAASLAQLLAQVNKGGTSWVDRVHLFGMISEMLHGAGSSPHPEVAANSDRLAACLLEGAGDAHFKVAASAMEALNEGLNGRNAKLFEAQLDRLMPLLFLRSVDAKDQLKQLAKSALAECPKQHAPEAVLAALSKSLQQSRAPKVKVAVLEYFVAVVTGMLDLEDHLELVPGPALRAVVSAIMHLVLDKNHDIRRASIRALEVIYRAEQGQIVLSAIHSLPPAEAAAVQMALAAVLPSIESEVTASMRASRPAPVASVSNAAAPTESSRRHSGEGLLRLPELPPQVLSARGPAKLAPASALARAPSKSGTLASPRSRSPGRLVSGDASPCAASPTMSRLGRQASGLLPASREADPLTAPQLGRQHSSCVTHTSSPVASPPISRTPPLSAATAGAAAATPPHSLSLLGRSATEPSAPESHAHLAGQALPAVSPLQGATALPSDLVPFDDIMEGQLRRLLVQLQGGLCMEGFQGLSRMAHVLPGSAWTPHFSQVVSALLSALGSNSPLLRESGLMLVRDLAAVRPDLFAGPLPVLLPRVLDCIVDSSREVVAAADEALMQLLGGLPPQPSLVLLLPSLPQVGEQLTADIVPGGLLYGTLKSLRLVVQRMAPHELQQALLPDLVPGLCASYCSPIADVRKATVDCLVSIWLGVGTPFEAHLTQLSVPQMKLLTIYRDKALQQRNECSAG